MPRQRYVKDFKNEWIFFSVGIAFTPTEYISGIWQNLKSEKNSPKNLENPIGFITFVD
jgi:hypothetical protein